MNCSIISLIYFLLENVGHFCEKIAIITYGYEKVAAKTKLGLLKIPAMEPFFVNLQDSA